MKFSPLSIALIVASAFLGGAVTTIVMNTHANPALAATQNADGEVETPVEEVEAEAADPFAAGENTVRADSFELTDKDGKAHARLGFDHDGFPALWMRQGDGWKQVTPDMGAAAKRVKLEEIAAEFMKKEEHKDPEIQVQHILIGFAGAGRSGATRSQDEAAALVLELMSKIEAGEDFTDLMKKNSEDPGPGTYTMVLDAANVVQGESYPRQGMVKAFGDTGWRLKVGEIGVANYDTTTSPFGYHIVKRLK